MHDSLRRLESMMLKERLLIVLGFLFLGLGAIGIFLPLLPTTPFILVAAGCFSRNKKLSAWLHKSRLFSDYLTNYKERGGLKKKTVITSLTFLWAMLAISAAYLKTLWAFFLFPAVGIAVTAHILYMSQPRK